MLICINVIELLDKDIYQKVQTLCGTWTPYDNLKTNGISINGCIDGFSRKIIWLEAYYTSSDPLVVAGY